MMMRECEITDIKGDLDCASKSVAKINHLEGEIYKNRLDYNERVKCGKDRLDALFSRQKRHILAARPYYQSSIQCHLAEDKLKQAKESYKRACLEYDDAKDNAEVAEKSLLAILASCPESDPDILTNLNKATQWVGDCITMKEDAQDRLKRCEEEYERLQAMTKVLANSLRSSISKAKSYYDIKDQVQMELDIRLDEIRQQQQEIHDVRSLYHAVPAHPDHNLGNAHQQHVEGDHDISSDRGSQTGSLPTSSDLTLSSLDIDLDDLAAGNDDFFDLDDLAVSNSNDLNDLDDLTLGSTDLCDLSDEDSPLELSLGSLSLDEGVLRDHEPQITLEQIEENDLEKDAD